MSLLIALTSAAPSKPSIGQSDEFVTRTTRDLAVTVRPWNWRILVGLLISCLGLAASPAPACNIPVFRYALENWQPDFYHVLVITRRPLESKEQTLVERLHNAGAGKQHPANLQVVVVNLNEKKASEALAGDMRGKQVPREAFDALDSTLGKMDIETPQMVVLYPSQFDRLAWSAELTEDTVDRLIDSPARQAIGERLLSGDSAVWVMIESGRSEDDQAAWNQLTQCLGTAEKLVKLPQRELIETDEFYRSDVAIDLKVKFSALKLSRDDPMEAAFISMLLGSEEDLNEFDEPIAVPIYGRGRSYFALVGKGIKEDMVIDNCQFLCGACSCQVKQDNPGVDMLMAVSWEERVTQQGSAAPPLPQLTGVGGLEMAALPTSGTLTPSNDNSAVNSLANSSDTISDPGDGSNSPSLNPADAASGSSDANGTNVEKVTSATGPHSPLDMPPSAELGFPWRLIAIVCGAVALAVVALMSMARGF